MKIRLRSVAITCAVLLTACGTPEKTSPAGLAAGSTSVNAAGVDAAAPGVEAGSEQDRTAAEIALAQSKYEQSLSAGFAWRAARLALNEAQAAYAEADYALARGKAQMATQLAADSLEQARAEAIAWQTRFPFNQ